LILFKKSMCLWVFDGARIFSLSWCLPNFFYKLLWFGLSRIKAHLLSNWTGNVPFLVSLDA
jgi:hypothetical protein